MLWSQGSLASTNELYQSQSKGSWEPPWDHAGALKGMAGKSDSTYFNCPSYLCLPRMPVLAALHSFSGGFKTMLEHPFAHDFLSNPWSSSDGEGEGQAARVGGAGGKSRG